MPRKKRDIRRDYHNMGFSEGAAKHSEGTSYKHPLVRKKYVVSGHDREDAAPYDEANLREARRLLEEAKKKQKQQKKGPTT